MRAFSTAERFWNSCRVWLGSGSMTAISRPESTQSPVSKWRDRINPEVVGFTSTVRTSSMLPVSASLSTRSRRSTETVAKVSTGVSRSRLR